MRRQLSSTRRAEKTTERRSTWAGAARHYRPDPEVTQICDVFRGKIIDVAKESLVVEATGNGNKIVAFIELIEPFGIIELARTGTVSLRRGRADH